MDHLEVGFVSFFGRTSNGCAPYDHFDVPYRWSRALVIPLWGLFLGWIDSFLVDEPLKLPLSNEDLNLLLQIVTVGYVMPMITVEMTILVPWSLTRIPLQLTRESQGSFIFNLH